MESRGRESGVRKPDSWNGIVYVAFNDFSNVKDPCDMKRNEKLIIVMAPIIISGCSIVGFIDPTQDPLLERVKSPNGRHVMADNEARWERQKEIVEDAILKQKRGEPILDGKGPGSRKEYSRFWNEQRNACIEYQDNPPKYIEYINKRLIEEGLE